MSRLLIIVKVLTIIDTVDLNQTKPIKRFRILGPLKLSESIKSSHAVNSYTHKLTSILRNLFAVSLFRYLSFTCYSPKTW